MLGAASSSSLAFLLVLGVEAARRRRSRRSAGESRRLRTRRGTFPALPGKIRTAFMLFQDLAHLKKALVASISPSLPPSLASDSERVK